MPAKQFISLADRHSEGSNLDYCLIFFIFYLKFLILFQQVLEDSDSPANRRDGKTDTASNFRIAEKADRVIAIDTDQRFIDYIEEEKEESSNETVKERLQTRLSLEDDPLLAPQEVDIVLMVNTYHFLSDRPEYLRRIRSGVKRGGKIILVDFKKGEMPVGPPEELKVYREEVIRDLTTAGFSEISSDINSLRYQYIITAFNN